MLNILRTEEVESDAFSDEAVFICSIFVMFFVSYLVGVNISDQIHAP